MKKVFLTLLVFVSCWNSSVSAQNGNSGSNGNAVISEVQVLDQGDGTALVEVRVSGNQASVVPGGSFTLTDESRLGFGVLTVSEVQGNTVLLKGEFSVSPSVGNGPRFVEMVVQVPGANPFIGRRLIRFPTVVVNQGN